jgi:pimeloyl-ACP methyl ester carboxylesterase
MNWETTSTAIAVTVHGPRNPNTTEVVLVHGAMDRAKSFRAVVRHLPDLRVIDYDRRGYGASIPDLPPASLVEHVDDLLDILGDRPTTVVAHSFGCLVVVSAAIRNPERFRGLGLWEPQVPWMEFWPSPVRQGLEAMAAEVDTDALAERVYASMVGEEAWRRLPEDLRAQRTLSLGGSRGAELVRHRAADVALRPGGGHEVGRFAGFRPVHRRGRRPQRARQPPGAICTIRTSQRASSVRSQPA